MYRYTTSMHVFRYPLKICRKLAGDLDHLFWSFIPPFIHRNGNTRLRSNIKHLFHQGTTNTQKLYKPIAVLGLLTYRFSSPPSCVEPLLKHLNSCLTISYIIPNMSNVSIQTWKLWHNHNETLLNKYILEKNRNMKSWCSADTESEV